MGSSSTDPLQSARKFLATERCDITGNLWGTDTRHVDHPCSCNTCVSCARLADVVAECGRLRDERQLLPVAGPERILLEDRINNQRGRLAQLEQMNDQLRAELTEAKRLALRLRKRLAPEPLPPHEFETIDRYRRELEQDAPKEEQA